MRPEPRMIAILLQLRLPHRVMIRSRAEFPVGIFSAVPRFRIADVAHQNHLSRRRLPDYRLKLRRIEPKSATCDRPRGHVEFDDPAAEVVKRFQSSQPIVDARLLPLRDDDE